MTEAPLRILLAADVPAGADSGAAGTEWQTAKALGELGCRVETVWGPQLGRRIRHGNLHALLELPLRYRALVLAASKRQDYDIYHLNQPFAWAAARLHQRRRMAGAVIIRSHGWEAAVDEALAPWRRRFGAPARPWRTRIAGAAIDAAIRGACRLAASSAAGIVVSAKPDFDYIASRYGVPPARLACIPQGVAETFLATPARGIDGERLRRLLFVGPPQLWKGVPVLIDAVSGLLARHGQLAFDWIAPPDQVAAVPALFPSALRERIRVRGPMPQQALSQAYDESGILLFPSLYEGFGKVPLEGMARGCCVVASAVGGVPAVMRDGWSGCIVPPGDAAAASAAVERLLADPAGAGAISARAAEAARRFTWPRFAVDLLAFYRRILNDRRAP